MALRRLGRRRLKRAQLEWLSARPAERHRPTEVKAAGAGKENHTRKRHAVTAASNTARPRSISSGAINLAIDLGDLPEAKKRLKTLRDERERLVHELAAVKIELPTIDELMPRLREKLQELESTIMADVPLGRLALGGLLGEDRLRIYADGRIEGSATLAPETLQPPKAQSLGGCRPCGSGGGRYARVCVPVPIILRVSGNTTLPV